MRRLGIILTVLMAAAHLSAQEPDTMVATNQNVPYFSVVATDGATVTSDDLKGKVTLLTFWASWCPSCRKEMKAIGRKNALASVAEHPDFLFLPISREESREAVMEFLAKHGYTFRSGLDPDRAIYSLFFRQEIPRNLIIDRDGRIAAIHTGYTRKDFATLVKELETMLNQDKKTNQ